MNDFLVFSHFLYEDIFSNKEFREKKEKRENYLC